MVWSLSRKRGPSRRGFKRGLHGHRHTGIRGKGIIRGARTNHPLKQRWEKKTLAAAAELAADADGHGLRVEDFPFSCRESLCFEQSATTNYYFVYRYEVPGMKLFPVFFRWLRWHTCPVRELSPEQTTRWTLDTNLTAMGELVVGDRGGVRYGMYGTVWCGTDPCVLWHGCRRQGSSSVMSVHVFT